MKKIFEIAAILTAALFSSCTKTEINDVPEDTAGLVFVASLESTTKTSIQEDGKVNWVSGDAICINGKKYSTTASGRVVAEFTAVSETATADAGGNYNAYYPTGICSVVDDNVVLTLAQEREMDLTGANCPMYAQSTTTDLTFKNICGVVKLSLQASGKSIKSILLESDEDLSGKITIADNKAAIDGEGFMYVLMTAEDEGVDISAAKNFFFALPERDYTSLTVTLTATDNTVCRKTYNGTYSVKANRIETITATGISFVDLTPKVSGNLGLTKIWDTCNLGASKPQEFGNYYQWAATEPIYSALTHTDEACTVGTRAATFGTALYTFPSTVWNFTFKTGNESGFVHATAPYADETTDVSDFYYTKRDDFYSKYNRDVRKNGHDDEFVFSGDNKSYLENVDDAAYQSKGSDWKVPSKDDFQDLAHNTLMEYTSDYNGTGIPGTIFYKVKTASDKFKIRGFAGAKEFAKYLQVDNLYYMSAPDDDYDNIELITEIAPSRAYYCLLDDHIFLPAAGAGNGTVNKSHGVSGFYWTADLYSCSDAYPYAYTLTFGPNSMLAPPVFMHAFAATTASVSAP